MSAEKAEEFLKDLKRRIAEDGMSFDLANVECWRFLVALEHSAEDKSRVKAFMNDDLTALYTQRAGERQTRPETSAGQDGTRLPSPGPLPPGQLGSDIQYLRQRLPEPQKYDEKFFEKLGSVADRAPDEPHVVQALKTVAARGDPVHRYRVRTIIERMSAAPEELTKLLQRLAEEVEAGKGFDPERTWQEVQARLEKGDRAGASDLLRLLFRVTQYHYPVWKLAQDLNNQGRFEDAKTVAGSVSASDSVGRGAQELIQTIESRDLAEFPELLPLRPRMLSLMRQEAWEEIDQVWQEVLKVVSGRAEKIPRSVWNVFETTKRVQEASPLLKDSRALLRQGRYEDADLMLTQAAALDPQNNKIQQSRQDCKAIEDHAKTVHRAATRSATFEELVGALDAAIELEDLAPNVTGDPQDDEHEQTASLRKDIGAVQLKGRKALDRIRPQVRNLLEKADKAQTLADKTANLSDAETSLGHAERLAVDDEGTPAGEESFERLREDARKLREKVTTATSKIKRIRDGLVGQTDLSPSDASEFVRDIREVLRVVPADEEAVDLRRTLSDRVKGTLDGPRYLGSGREEFVAARIIEAHSLLVALGAPWSSEGDIGNTLRSDAQSQPYRERMMQMACDAAASWLGKARRTLNQIGQRQGGPRQGDRDQLTVDDAANRALANVEEADRLIQAVSGWPTGDLNPAIVTLKNRISGRIAEARRSITEAVYSPNYRSLDEWLDKVSEVLRRPEPGGGEQGPGHDAEQVHLEKWLQNEIAKQVRQRTEIADLAKQSLADAQNSLREARRIINRVKADAGSVPGAVEYAQLLLTLEALIPQAEKHIRIRQAWESVRKIGVPAGSLTAIVLLLVWVVPALVGPNPPPPPVPSVAPTATTAPALPTPTATVEPSTPTPGCTSAATWLETINAQEKEGQWDVAASNALIALKTPNLCKDDRAVLAQKAVTDGREALFMQPPKPGEISAQLRLVDAYASLRDLAREFGLQGLPSMNPKPIARRAYDLELFLLARSAAEEALRAGDLKVTDRADVDFYYAATTNAGSYLARSSVDQWREKGKQMLAVAHAIDEQYPLRRGKAREYLVEFIGSDSAKWPKPDSSDPILAAIGR